MFGFLGAYIAFNNLELWKSKKNLLLILGIVLLIYPNVIDEYNPFFANIDNSFIRNYLFLTTTSLGTLLLLPFLSDFKIENKGYAFKVITFFSTISYYLYLVNDTFVKLLIRYSLPQLPSEWLNYFLHWTLSISIAYLLYRFFENPFTKMRDRVSIDDNRN
jgi:peptidoglycan/LPS O-acetylase OafA/YrhL